ncbi:MAG: peptidylprolyl isomerase [Elainella sp.]
MQWCQQQQVTWDYLHRVVLRGLRLEKFKHLWFEPKIISEFLRVKPDLDQVIYSHIQVKDFFLAQELYFQIQEDGADFFELAREYSLEAEQQDESWAEPVALASLPAEISTLFKDGREGKVHKPVLVNGLFWVVRLDRFYPARLTKAMRAILLEQLYSNWLQSKIQELIAQPGAVAIQPPSSVAPEVLVPAILDIRSAPESEAEPPPAVK